MKKYRESRTLWFNVLTMVSIAGASLLTEPEFREYIGHHATLLIIAVNIANVGLRMITDTGLSSDA